MRPKFTEIILSIILLAACTPVMGAVDKPTPKGGVSAAGEVAITSSPSGMDAQAMTPQPSETVEIIPTSTTVEATKAPTVNEANARLESMNVTNWEIPSTAAIAKDMVGGALFKFVESLAKPFPSNSVNVEKIFPIENSFSICPEGMIGKRYSESNLIMIDPDKTPVKWLAHFLIKADQSAGLWQDIYVDFQQVKNAPGSSKEYSILMYYTPDNGNPAERRHILFEEMAYSAPLRPGQEKYEGKWPAKGISIIFDADFTDADEINKKLDSWSATGDATPLEGILLRSCKSINPQNGILRLASC